MTRYYAIEVVRGATVVNDEGDGEVEWFPTLAEAQAKADELNHPEEDR